MTIDCEYLRAATAAALLEAAESILRMSDVDIENMVRDRHRKFRKLFVEKHEGVRRLDIRLDFAEVRDD